MSKIQFLDMDGYHLDLDYKKKLLILAGISTTKARRYSKLFQYLYLNEFYSKIDLDENRIEDAKCFRREYLMDHFDEKDVPPHFYIKTMNKNPNVLEVLAVFTDNLNLSYIDGGRNRIFWECLCNLGLDKFENSAFDEVKVGEIVQKWMNREYHKSGNGSIFPLKHDKLDQRRLEMWVQGVHYVNENY